MIQRINGLSRFLSNIHFNCSSIITKRRPPVSKPIFSAIVRGTQNLNSLSQRKFATTTLESKKSANDFLHNSVCEADIEGIRKAVQNGADVNGFFILNDERIAVLHWAARHSSRNGSLELLKFLVDNKASLELRVEDGWTPLAEACDEGGLEAVKFLISRGANVDIKNGEGETPLHMAVNGSNEEMVKLLISSKAFLDNKNAEGKTPLAAAAEDGKLDIVQLLLEAQANTTIADHNNLTPSQIADGEGHHKVARLIRRHTIKARVKKLQQDLTELQQVIKEDEDSELSY